MKENTIMELPVVRDRPFINVTCVDCHLAKKPDQIHHSTSSGERAVRNARAKIALHGPGHHLYMAVGRKPT